MWIPISASGWRRLHSAAAGKPEHGTMTAAEETIPKFSRSSSAGTVPSHIPMSSAWITATRSRAPKPRRIRAAFAGAALGEFCEYAFTCFLELRIHLARPALERNRIFEYAQLHLKRFSRLLQRQVRAGHSAILARPIQKPANARQHLGHNQYPAE